ncbi:MAG TPA: thiol:disulfide interchange protein DsbA/DsbL [Burkholderiales bacterium]|jgi:thiol:disulfide interchange protein DsbA
MHASRRRLLRALTIAGAALAARPVAAVETMGAAVEPMGAAGDLLEELDYRLIAQQPLADPARIEVVEFFYYGCRWCSELEPHLNDWLGRKPADVAFRYQPAIRNTRWLVLTKAFYAFRALGVQPQLHGHIYRAYHREEVNLEDEAVLTAWALKQGVALKPLERLLGSDEVMAQVQAAREATDAYEIETTPSVVVDGRYLTSSGMTGGVGELMRVVEDLIVLARQERAARG